MKQLENHVNGHSIGFSKSCIVTSSLVDSICISYALPHNWLSFRHYKAVISYPMFNTFLFYPTHLDKNNDFDNGTNLFRHYQHGRRRDTKCHAVLKVEHDQSAFDLSASPTPCYIDLIVLCLMC